MGKGDQKSRIGKIKMGSYGIKRPRKPSVSAMHPKKKAPEKETSTKA